MRIAIQKQDKKKVIEMDNINPFVPAPSTSSYTPATIIHYDTTTVVALQVQFLTRCMICTVGQPGILPTRFAIISSLF